MKILHALQKAVTLTAFLPLIAFANPSNPSGLVAKGEHGGSHHEGHHEHEEGHYEGEHHHEGENHHVEGDHEARRAEEGHHENFNHNDFHGNFNDYHHGGGTYMNGNIEGNPVTPIVVPNTNPIYVVPPSNQGN
jgi:hypothetical protein